MGAGLDVFVAAGGAMAGGTCFEVAVPAGDAVFFGEAGLVVGAGLVGVEDWAAEDGRVVVDSVELIVGVEVAVTTWDPASPACESVTAPVDGSTQRVGLTFVVSAVAAVGAALRPVRTIC